MSVAVEAFEVKEETEALQRFKRENPDLFQKEDGRLLMHLGIVIFLLLLSTAASIALPWLELKIFFGAVSAFFWFSLINVTIHHHHTHHNAAAGARAKAVLDFLYLISVPNAPKRLSRYTRAHLNHHARPFHETDVDHHYAKDRYCLMSKNLWTRTLYFLELTFVGGYVPGWDDDHYMNRVPLEEWNQKDYVLIKQKEKKRALRTAILQWSGFLILARFLTFAAWGWAFPMLLVKNWAHYLGQFQHYDERFVDPSRSVWNRTKTYDFPGWVNYLAGGEISGHFLHHLFPEIPYYNVEPARRRFEKDPELSRIFLTY